MAALGIALDTIGISQAKGSDLVAHREQIRAVSARDKTTAQVGEDRSTQRAALQRRELSPAQQRQVAELQQIDRVVRAHEQAHLAAGRGLITSAARFSYTYGPDGKQYAVAGEVGIDTSPEKKPEANIDKGIRIQAAALAPKDPSPQDYHVASIGGQIEARGRSDLSRQQAEERALAAERNARARDEAQRQGEEVAVAKASEGQAAAEAAGGDGAFASDARQRLSQAYSAGAAANATLSVFA